MAAYRKIVCAELTTEQTYYWLSALVIPRPIAWVSTLQANGKVNLAPFSSFNYIAHSPALVAININRLENGERKDTAINLLRTKECVIQLAEVGHTQLIDRSAQPLAADQSEVDLLGLETMPSACVQVPRIANGSVQLECVLDQMFPLGTGLNELFILEVRCFQVAERILVGNKVEPTAYQPLARVSGPFYAGLSEVYSYVDEA